MSGISRLQKNTSFASTDWVQQHTRISSTLRESEMAGNSQQEDSLNTERPHLIQQTSLIQLLGISTLSPHPCSTKQDCKKNQSHRFAHAFTTLGSDPTSGFGTASDSDPAFIASGFGPASGSGPAFAASSFEPAFGLRPLIGLWAHFWASAPHRASASYRASVLHLLLSGPGPAFTAFGLQPSTYYIQVWTPRIYCFQAHLKSKIDLDSNSPKRYSEEQV
ncbi:hypothetical protein CRG98_032393 [Punica granatum]|uniref:Uncharacterized protein n=1 Tax=Punica granatum TaxID=22663 RepID=A0A2I0IT99_PUNGR|nr:hypothetical protein CRG98_032393 [Punica granatum]